MQTLDGVTVVTMILVASFAIERITAAVMFLIAYFGVGGSAGSLEGESRVQAERRQKLLAVAISGVLGAMVVVFYPQVRALTALGLKVTPVLDALLTGIVLVAGADRLAVLQKAGSSPGGSKPEPQPIKITGSLTLEEKAAAVKTAGHAD